MAADEWLLFLPQVPSSPSSLRVAIWRRMRDAGALGLQNGVWALPHNPQQERLMQELLEDVNRDGGSGLLLVAVPLAPKAQKEIIERFRSGRDDEYTEFCERCGEFIAEIEKETGLEKFTFAEMEENEEDLKKLAGWLRKIQARDFFGGRRAEEAALALARCNEVFRNFVNAVYAREGFGPLDNQEDGGDEK